MRRQMLVLLAVALALGLGATSARAAQAPPGADALAALLLTAAEARGFGDEARRGDLGGVPFARRDVREGANLIKITLFGEAATAPADFVAATVAELPAIARPGVTVRGEVAMDAPALGEAAARYRYRAFAPGGGVEIADVIVWRQGAVLAVARLAVRYFGTPSAYETAVRQQAKLTAAARLAAVAAEVSPSPEAAVERYLAGSGLGAAYLGDCASSTPTLSFGQLCSGRDREREGLRAYQVAFIGRQPLLWLVLAPRDGGWTAVGVAPWAGENVPWPTP